MLHGFACDSAAEAELASQLLGILSQHFGQVLCPTCCQKLGHVSYALFAKFEQLMQEFARLPSFEGFEAKSELWRVSEGEEELIRFPLFRSLIFLFQEVSDVLEYVF